MKLNIYRKNILYVCSRCTLSYIKEGKTWYSNVYFMCVSLSKEYNVDLYSVVGALAALSPGIKWYKNVELVERLLYLFNTKKNLYNIPTLGVYGKKNYFKAIRILEGEQPLDVLGGNKVRAFYNCISHVFSKDAPIVVLDRHAVSICVGKPMSDRYIQHISTEKKYRQLENDYIVVAEMLGIEPHQLQAMVWLYWRDYFAKFNKQINVTR